MNWKRFVSIAAVVGMVFAFSATALAETHTRFVTGNPEPKIHDNSVFIISNTLDFSDLRTTNLTGSALQAGVTRGDTVQLLDIPAGVVVLGVGMNIYSAWTTSGLTCSGAYIGDGSGVSGWLQSIDLGPTASGTSTTFLSGVSGLYGGNVAISTTGNHTLQYIVNPGSYATAGGKYYSAADTIDLVLPNWAHRTSSGLTDFVMQVWATCVKPSTQEAYTKPNPRP